MTFSLPYKLMEGSQFRSCGLLYVSILHQVYFSYKLVDVQSSSEQHCARKQAKVPKFLHTNTDTHRARAGKQASNKVNKQLIKFHLQCAVREYYCCVRALGGSCCTLEMVGPQK